MKVTLRNLALGTALVASCAVFAQDAPFTVTKDWGGNIDAATMGAAPSTSIRTATGFDGKIYAVDKDNLKLLCIENGNVTVVREDLPAGIACAISHDDAGNLIILKGEGFFATNDSKHVVIVPADGGDLIEADLEYAPDDQDKVEELSFRTDNLGRTIGNVLSDEGGVFYIAFNNGLYVGGVHLVNGQCVVDDFPYLSESTGDAASSETTATPAFDTVAEIYDQENPENAFYYNHRGQLGKQFVDGTMTAIPVNYPDGWAVSSSPGFDVFTLGDVKYQVIRSTNGEAHSANFVIADFEGNVYFTSDIAGEDDNTGWGNCSNITAQKVDENTVKIYNFKPNAAAAYCAVYTVALPGSEEPEPTPVEGGFNVKRNWIKKLTQEEDFGVNPGAEYRTGTGVNGKVYVLNKADKALYSIDAEGLHLVRENIAEATGVAITSDDAGNILFQRGWAGNSSTTALAIIPGSDLANGEIITLDAVYPDDYEPNRSDNFGRMVGDIFSEEGAIAFLTNQNAGGEGPAPRVVGLYLQNGEQNTDFFEYASDPVLNTAMDGQSVAFPRYNNIGEQLDFDPNYNGYYAVRRGEYVQYVNEDEEMTTMPRPAAVEGEMEYYGFPGADVFWLGGKEYFVYPYTTATKQYQPNFLIADAEGNLVWKSDYEEEYAVAGSYGNGGSLTARVINDNTVEIYAYQPIPGLAVASMYTVTLSEGGDEPEPQPTAPELYLRGEFNDWGTTIKAESEVYDGIYNYFIEIEELEGEFKFGTEDWAISFGGGNDEEKVLKNGFEIVSWENGQNFVMPEKARNVEMVLMVNPDYSQPSSLIAYWEPADQASERGAFAYNLNVVNTETESTISYTLSSPATKATLVLTPTTDGQEEVRVELPAPVVGDNKFVYAPSEEDGVSGKYSWAIEVASENLEAEAPAFALVETPEYNLNGTKTGRGGLVTITDPEYDSFGYTAVAASGDRGVTFYDQRGNKTAQVSSGVVNSLNSSPLRGDQRFGKAVFASWADANSGYYYFDPLNPEAEPVNILEGTRGAGGLFSYDGVQTAGGSPCVAFSGKGDDTYMWLFEEDLYKNMLVGYPIGNAEKLTVAADIVCDWSKQALSNTAVGLDACEYGLFASQTRAKDWQTTDPNCTPANYIGLDGALVSDYYDLMPEGTDLDSSNGVIALSTDGKILAIGTQTTVEFFSVTWEDKVLADGTYKAPKLEYLYNIEMPVTTTFSQARFDAGNNLHFTGVSTSDYDHPIEYAVIVLPGENVATTAAKSESFVETAIKSIISIEDAAAADAVYYNLNGIKVAADALTSGVYVKVQGNKASKVFVK